MRSAEGEPRLREDGAFELPLRNRRGAVMSYAILDAEDMEWAIQWAWCLTPAGYVRRTAKDENGKKRTVLLHRQLMGLELGDKREIDHINRNPLDCRRANLRIATRAENQQNVPAHADAKSRHRGVSWSKCHSKWWARIHVAGQTRSLGLFASELEAADAARRARIEVMPYAVD